MVVTLPSQNQLYGFYISRCVHHRVGKPNAQVLQLLFEDESSRLSWQQAKAAEHHITVEELREIDGDASSALEIVDRPLAMKTTFRLPNCAPDGVPVHVGTRGMLAMLDLIQQLPLLEELDLSNITSWYIADAFTHTRAGAPSGNAVVKRLCEVVKSLPALRKLDVRTHPIGTLAAYDLLEAIQSCQHLIEVDFCRKGVEMSLCRAIDVALENNRRTVGQVPAPTLPEVFSPLLSRIPMLDRKTLSEQQKLCSLLTGDSNFFPVLTEEELGEMVLHARLMSTSEVAWRCRKGGLRGDGEHLFILKDGSLCAYPDRKGLKLSRGDYFGDTYEETIMFPSTTIVEKERGVVYALPLASCGLLLKVWKERVSQLYFELRAFPMMRMVDTWTRIRICTCSQIQFYKPDEVVLKAGDSELVIWIVLAGYFEASTGTMEDRVASGRDGAYRFTKSDVFGIENIVARKGCSSVRVSAGKEKTSTYSALVVRGCAIRIVSDSLRTMFMSLAYAYSLHEDLRQIAPKELDSGAGFESPKHP